MVQRLLEVANQTDSTAAAFSNSYKLDGTPLSVDSDV
jgi:hypothetical protein